VLAVTPVAADQWLFARPAALLGHPRLGPLLARTFDDAAERALIRRAERTGYDVRALERAAIAWMPRGTVYVSLGPLDVTQVSERLWNRMLSPRRRASLGPAVARTEGVIGSSVTSLLVRSDCRMAAYAETVPTLVDRILSPRSAEDPSALLVWETRQIPADAAPDDAPLIQTVRRLRVTVVEREGVDVSIDIDGSMPPDAALRFQRAIAAFIRSPLGELIGAVQWMGSTANSVRVGTNTARIEQHVSWRVLEAVSDALRGQINWNSPRGRTSPP